MRLTNTRTHFKRNTAQKPSTTSLIQPSALDTEITGQLNADHDFSRIQVHASAPETLQTKLAINQPGDSYEQEAERVAEQVTRMETPAPSEVPSLSQSIELQDTDASLTRKSAGDTSAYETTNAPFIVNEVLSSSGGQPLDEDTRSFMEPRFGHDFSRVRVHTDERAVESAWSVNALAYTVGQDIVFGREQYNPGTNEGNKLLAHELVHTIQQGDSIARTGPAAPHRSEISEPLEAEVTAQNASDDRQTSIAARSTSYMVQRIPIDSPSLQPQSPEISSPRELIDNALKSKSSGDVQAIRDFSPATEKEKIDLIAILLDQVWVGPLDELALGTIWNSFGDAVLQIGAAHFDIWKKCVDRGAELGKLQAVVVVKEKFAADVKSTALNYLRLNQDYIQKESEQLGLQQSGGSPQQNQQLQEVQQMAGVAVAAQDAQARLRQIIVGYSNNLNQAQETIVTTWYPTSFDPEHKPDIEHKPEGGFFTTVIGTDQPVIPWDKVNEQYEKTTGVIIGIANRYPSLYTLVGQDKQNELKEVAQDSPEQARTAISQVMQGISQKISEATLKIGGEIDYRDLVPIHQQFYGGMEVPSGTPWSSPLYKWIAEDDIGSYQTKAFWSNLGLTTLAAAAFVVAELATAGSATFFIAAGAGLGIGVFQAGQSWDKYLNLAGATNTNVTPETALVTQGQATGALIEAILNTVNVFISAYGPLTKGAGVAEKSLLEAEQLERAALASADKAAPAAAPEIAEVAVDKLVQKGFRDEALKTLETAGIDISKGSKLYSQLMSAGESTRGFINEFYKTPGFDKVVANWAQGGNTQMGARFLMKYCMGRLRDAPLRFEWPTGLLDTASGAETWARYIDIVIEGGSNINPGNAIAVELKSWTSKTLAKSAGKIQFQLIRDTALYGPTNIRWVFDGTKVSLEEVINTFIKIITDDPYLNAQWGGTESEIRQLLSSVVDVYK